MRTLQQFGYLLRIAPLWFALRVADHADSIALRRHGGEHVGDGEVVCLGHGKECPPWPCREFLRAHHATAARAKMSTVLTGGLPLP